MAITNRLFWPWITQQASYSLESFTTERYWNSYLTFSFANAIEFRKDTRVATWRSNQLQGGFAKQVLFSFEASHAIVSNCNVFTSFK